MKVKLLALAVVVMSVISCKNMQPTVETWNAELRIEERALLGEGALWHNNELLWIDIVTHIIANLFCYSRYYNTSSLKNF